VCATNPMAKSLDVAFDALKLSTDCWALHIGHLRNPIVWAVQASRSPTFSPDTGARRYHDERLFSLLLASLCTL
jgi:hypothetical protein